MTIGDSQDPFSLFQVKRPEEYMDLALREARKAFEAGEVPVGAVLVETATGRVIARAYNQRELLRDPTAHAEILVITQGAAHYGAWRLSEVTLYVTLEPCLMCAGAVILARIPRVVYGADDPKAGAHRSVHQVLTDPRNNHRPEVLAGVRSGECGEILREFFRKRRKDSTLSHGNGGVPGTPGGHEEEEGPGGYNEAAGPEKI